MTPGGERGFLAAGAKIALLDLTGASPVELTSQSVPGCQPLAMRYYQEASGTHDLFVAGGALGVFRYQICGSWFQNPSVPCSGPWGELLVQPALEAGYFERKRCVDVDVLEPLSGSPVLFALFAASSDPLESAGGPTELRAYTWTGSGATQLAAFTFDSTPGPIPTNPVQVGTALAVDPADHDSIYVALGKGGIYRADLGAGGLTATRIWLPGCTSCAVTCGGTGVQHVRDLAIVEVATTPPKSVLYAALNYDEILEISDLGGTPTCDRQPLALPSYAERISARVTNGTEVLVALAAQSSDGKYEDSLAPTNVNGFWRSICIYVGLEDPNDPHYSGARSLVQFYGHDFSPGQPALAALPYIDYDVKGVGWNQVHLRDGAPASHARLFACSHSYGLESYDVGPSAATVTKTSTYVAEAFPGQSAVVSALNPGLVSFAGEFVGASLPPKAMAYVDPTLQPQITPIPTTDTAPCPNAYPPPQPQAGCATTLREPRVYSSGIFEVAHWPDSNNPGREYFVTGARILEPVNDLCGVQFPLCTEDPCTSPGGVPKWLLNLKAFPAGTTNRRNGWRVASLAIPSQGPPASGPAMSPRWAQIDVSTTTYEQSTDTDDKVQSLADPRTTNGVPNALYLTRAGMSHVKVLRPSDIQAWICNSYGNGELITVANSGAPGSPVVDALMHVELEDTGGGQLNPPCSPVAPCPIAPGSGPHFLMSAHTCVYRTKDNTGSNMYVLACAAGSVAAASQATPSSCQWTGYAGLPMLVLFDVTQTGNGSFTAPQLLRVGHGSMQGNAFAVVTKTVSNMTFAYVGDLLGRIWVFRVDGSEILPPPTPNVPPVPGGTYLATTPTLKELGVVEMPVDPFDGQRANCIDLEVHGNYLYCAMGRLGVGVVDISSPDSPLLVAVFDTPGLALGLAKRVITVGSTNVTQLIVCDSRCGVLVLQ